MNDERFPLKDARNWKKTKIGDICIVGRGSSPRPINDSKYFEGGTIPWIKIADATKSGKYLYDTKEKVNEYGASFSRLMPEGTLIVAASGTLGYSQFLGVPGCIHDGWLYLHSFKGVNEHFLYYLFKWRQQHFYNMAYGAAIQNINTSILREMEINLPSIYTQNKIAFILSTYDSHIENNRRRIQLIEQSARLLYREWFVHLRFPGHEHVRIIDGVPEGWGKGTVSDFYKTTSGGTPSRKNPDFFTGEINWVKTQELQEGFIFETDEKITEDAISNSSARLFPVNTVLVAMYGATIGQTAILANPAATNQACCALFPDAKQTHYIHAYLFLRENKNGLINLSQGAAQKNISQEIIKNYHMVMPSKMIMTEFIESLEPVFMQIKNLQLQNSKLINARDILLPRLMNGAITV